MAEWAPAVVEASHLQRRELVRTGDRETRHGHPLGQRRSVGGYVAEHVGDHERHHPGSPPREHVPAAEGGEPGSPVGSDRPLVEGC